MVKNFEKLTKYIPLLMNENIGEWDSSREGDGSEEHPFLLPFVNYSETVYDFCKELYAFESSFDLTNYHDILEKNGVRFDYDSLKDMDVSSLDSQCILAMIECVAREDRFCEGLLLDFLLNGNIVKWLTRLKEIDESSVL